jgi:hypothetical protein
MDTYNNEDQTSGLKLNTQSKVILPPNPPKGHSRQAKSILILRMLNIKINMLFHPTFVVHCFIRPLPKPLPRVGGALIQENCVYFGLNYEYNKEGNRKELTSTS